MKVVIAAIALLSSVTALTSDEKNLFVSKHNDYRRTVAKGQQGSLPKAANMAKIVWDDGVEDVMSSYLSQCNYAHNGNAADQIENADTYFNLDSRFWSNAGENLYWSSGTSQSNSFYINQAVQLWYDEVTTENWYYRAYGGTQADYNAGHFTQIIWADTRYIGCAVKKCSGFTLVGCNYVKGGNVQGQYPYVQSSTAASGCPSDMPNNNDGLCDGCGNPNYYYCGNYYSNCDTDLKRYCPSDCTMTSSATSSYDWLCSDCRAACGSGNCDDLRSTC